MPMLRNSPLRRTVGGDAALGLLALVLVGVALLLAYTGDLRGFFAAKPDQTVRADFVDAKQLREGDEVRIDGVKVGEVDAFARDRSRRVTTVTMKLFDSAGPLYRDARAGLRFGTLLGGRFYVDLQRGTPGGDELADTTIPMANTFSQVELDDITSVVAGDARRGLRALPGGLADGLGDAHATATVLETLGDVAPSVQRAVRGVRGQQPDTDLTTLISETDRTVSALDTPTQKLRAVVSGAASLVQTTAARERDLRAVLGRGPAAMSLTDATLADLRTTVGKLDPLVRKLEGPAGDVAPTLAELRPVVVDADALLLKARPLLRDLRPAVTLLARAAKGGLPMIREAIPSLDRIDKSILPFLAEKDPGTGLTVSQAIGPGLNGLGSIAGQEDAQGHFARFPATAGSSSVALPCQTYVNNPDKDALVQCKSLQESLQALLSYKPLTQRAAGR